jgi:hypothetical protein
MTTIDSADKLASEESRTFGSPVVARLMQSLLIVVQLGLLVIVIRQFQLVNSAFIRIVLLAFGGFLIHQFLPMRARMPFFLALSLAGIGLVFGPVAGAWLIAVGLVLVGICYLPIVFSGRIALLLAVGAGLVAVRAGWVEGPWSDAIWPILGSMFMFRLVVYLYDTREDSNKEPIVRTLCYFFMLPNVCFPLFPVIDYTR